MKPEIWMVAIDATSSYSQQIVENMGASSTSTISIAIMYFIAVKLHHLIICIM